MAAQVESGVLSLIYAASHADGPLKNLACLTTPVDWSEMGLTAIWSDEKHFDVDRLVDTLGIVPLDDTHIGVYVVDVSGHGVPSALLSVSLSRLLTADPASPTLAWPSAAMSTD